MKTLLLFALLPALIGAEEKSRAPNRTEGEIEAAHDGSYAYMGTGVEFERPKLNLFARGYRLTEDGHATHQAHVGVGRPMSLAKSRVNLTPGLAFVAGEEKLRGVALTLDAGAELKGFIVEASLTQTNPISAEGLTSLWLYPLTVERKVSRNWGLAGVLETLWTERGSASEYGFRVVRHDRLGQWYTGYMTASAEHGRDHRLRFGRIFTLQRND